MNRIQRHKFEASKNEDRKKRSNVIVSASLVRSFDWRFYATAPSNARNTAFDIFRRKKKPPKSSFVPFLNRLHCFRELLSFFHFIRFTRPSVSLALSFAVCRFAPHLQTAPIFILLCLVIEFTLFSCFMLLSLHAPPATIGTGLLCNVCAVCVNRFLFADFSK